MEIYVVQQGDTIYSIAKKYGVSSLKLITDNGLDSPYILVTGQTIVITHPVQTYIVQEGDTLQGIAASFGVPVLQLLRNNPFLANDVLIPGETITISYQNDAGKISINGYAFPFIRNDVLKMTLPYLTYLTVFNYQITGNGDIIENSDDTELIQTTKAYGVAPLMIITNLTGLGEVNIEDINVILTNSDVQDMILDKMLAIIEAKGFLGINFTFQYINEANQQLYINLLTKAADALSPKGYLIFVTINPGLDYNENEITFQHLDYAEISQKADSVNILSYDWVTPSGPPPNIPITETRSLLDYIISQVPLDKLRIGLPTLGYDWELPYEEGVSRTASLNFYSALALAAQVNAEIQYDETILSPYFEYIATSSEGQVNHIVIFKDARSIDSAMKILKQNLITNIGIWNIMYFFSQLWMVINTQYEIEKILTAGDI